MSILEFKGLTVVNLEPKKVLGGALEVADSLDRVIVLGVEKNGKAYYASTNSDIAELNLDTDLFKAHIIKLALEYIK